MQNAAAWWQQYTNALKRVLCGRVSELGTYFVFVGRTAGNMEKPTAVSNTRWICGLL